MDIRAKIAASKERKAKRESKAKELWRGRPKLPSRKKLIESLDNVLSVQVRAETMAQYGQLCPFCGKNPIQDCFHFFSRRHFKTRWDRQNVIGSCKPCNNDMNYHPGRYFAWYVREFGQEQFLALEARHRGTSHYSRTDLSAMLDQINGISDCKPKLDQERWI